MSYRNEPTNLFEWMGICGPIMSNIHPLNPEILQGQQFLKNSSAFPLWHKTAPIKMFKDNPWCKTTKATQPWRSTPRRHLLHPLDLLHWMIGCLCEKGQVCFPMCISECSWLHMNTISSTCLGWKCRRIYLNKDTTKINNYIVGIYRCYGCCILCSWSGGLQPAKRKGLITLLMSAAGKTC